MENDTALDPLYRNSFPSFPKRYQESNKEKKIDSEVWNLGPAASPWKAFLGKEHLHE